ncbi:MAG: hypothetical protein GXO69_03580 [Acidobacteria bacterium]|nr:hypothetical protein [Acidobacteriota bacterium]
MYMIPYRNWETTISEDLGQLEARVEKSNVSGVRVSKLKGEKITFLIRKRSHLGPLGPIARMTFCGRNNMTQVEVTIRPYHVVTVVVSAGILYSLLGTMIPTLLATGNFLSVLVSVIFLFLGYSVYWLSFDKVMDQLENRITAILETGDSGTFSTAPLSPDFLDFGPRILKEFFSKDSSEDEGSDSKNER